MREVADRRILVTLCPLSNVRLQCVRNVEELPIRKFLDASVRFSINSDDPAYFGGVSNSRSILFHSSFDGAPVPTAET